MGASKRVAELCLQALYTMEMEKAVTMLKAKKSGCANLQQPKMKLCMVRFGNVLDSSGSVILMFRRQVRDEGPVMLTHPEITRYVMTIPERAQLVTHVGAMAKCGTCLF